MCAERFEQRGILTDKDVKFLREEEVPGTPEQRSRTYQRIRERVAAAMHDFEILLKHLPEKQHKKTFNLLEEDDEKSFEEVGAEMTAFLYMLSNSDNTRPDIVREEDPIRRLMRFRSSLTRGIRKGKRSFGHSPGVVSVAATTPLYETPDPQIVREELNSQVLANAIRRLDEKYDLSEVYEEDETVIGMTEKVAAVNELFAEWDEELASRVIKRRQKADEFVYPPGDPFSTTYAYRDEFDKDPDSEG